MAGTGTKIDCLHCSRIETDQRTPERFCFLFFAQFGKEIEKGRAMAIGYSNYSHGNVSRTDSF